MRGGGAIFGGPVVVAAGVRAVARRPGRARTAMVVVSDAALAVCESRATGAGSREAGKAAEGVCGRRGGVMGQG